MATLLPSLTKSKFLFHSVKLKSSCALFVLFILISINNGYSQNQYFQSYSSQDGLLSNKITGIVQDKAGVIYFASDLGLFQFKNNKAEQIKRDKKGGIYSLFCDSHDNLWIGNDDNTISCLTKTNKWKSFDAKDGIRDQLALQFIEFKDVIIAGHISGISIIFKDDKVLSTNHDGIPKTPFERQNNIESDNWITSFGIYNNRLFATSIEFGVFEITFSKKKINLKPLFNSGLHYGSFFETDKVFITGDPNCYSFSSKDFFQPSLVLKPTFVSDRRPVKFIKVNNSIYASCDNMAFYKHGLIKIVNGNEELLLPSNLDSKQLFYSRKNKQIYFGTRKAGLYIANEKVKAKLYKPDFCTNDYPIVSVLPNSNQSIVLTDNGLYITINGEIKKHIQVIDFLNFSKPFKKRLSKFFPQINNDWDRYISFGLKFKKLIKIQNKWHVLTKLGIYILNKNFEFENFIPLYSTDIKYDEKGNFAFDYETQSLVYVPNNFDYSLMTDSRLYNSKLPVELSSIEKICKDIIAVGKRDGIAILVKNKWVLKKILNYKTGVFSSTSYDNRFLCLYTTEGKLNIYDSKKRYQQKWRFNKETFNNESVIKLSSLRDLLIVLTNKRLYFFKNGKWKSTSYFHWKNDFTNISANENEICLFNDDVYLQFDYYSLNELFRVEPFVKIDELSKETIRVNNKQKTFFEISVPNLKIDVSTYNTLNNEDFAFYYRIENEEWAKLDNSGIINLRNLSFGTSVLEIKYFNINTQYWKKLTPFIIKRIRPWYLSIIAIFCYGILGIITTVLITRHLTDRKRKIEIENLEIQNKLTSLKMEALQSQMNPHFVFNALNSIQKFILDINQEKALHFLNQFSVLIRKVLDYSNIKTISIEEELEFIQLYSEIENLRFQNLIVFKRTIDCDEEIQIPPLLIQPLLENAIIYGKRDKDGKMEIHYSIIEAENKLEIEVSNRIPDVIAKNHPFTSRSKEIIEKRIALYDPNAIFLIETDNDVFTVKILLNVYG